MLELTRRHAVRSSSSSLFFLFFLAAYVRHEKEVRMQRRDVTIADAAAARCYYCHALR